ncbi:MAG: hypothetical protein ACK55I_24765, partial [bacterium]
PYLHHGQSFVLSRNPDHLEKKLAENNGTLAITFIFNDQRYCDIKGLSFLSYGFKNASSSLTMSAASMHASTYQLGREEESCLVQQESGFVQVDHSSKAVIAGNVSTAEQAVTFRVRLVCLFYCYYK